MSSARWPFTLLILHTSLLLLQARSNDKNVDVRDFDDSTCLLQTHIKEAVFDRGHLARAAQAAVVDVSIYANASNTGKVRRTPAVAPWLDGGADPAGGITAWDWMYQIAPGSCSSGPLGTKWDNTQYSLASKVGLPILFITLMVLIYAARKSGTEDVARQQQEGPQLAPGEHPLEQPKQRRNDLDWARILCVACVVTEHSGGHNYTIRNVGWCMNWVLPYLYITSAIGFMKSMKPMQSYIMRLTIVFVVGVGANWIADIIIQRDWQNDFGDTIFQMWYVVMLIVMAFLTYPLRNALRWRKQNPGEKPDSWLFWAPMAFFGLLTLAAFVGFFVQTQHHLLFNFGQSSWFNNYGPIFKSAPLAVIQVAGTLFLCHFACLYNASDLLPWLLMLKIFIPLVVMPYQDVGYPHDLELYVFAMVVEAWGLRGAQSIAYAVQNYWPLVLFFLLFCSIPDAIGRCDLIPPRLVIERLRFYSCEVTFVLMLLSGTFICGNPFNCLTWLTWWALYAYCFHVAWARILPIPWGAVLTYLSVIVVYALYKGVYDTGKYSEGSPAAEALTPGADVARRKKGADMAGG